VASTTIKHNTFGHHHSAVCFVFLAAALTLVWATPIVDEEEEEDDEDDDDKEEEDDDAASSFLGDCLLPPVELERFKFFTGVDWLNTRASATPEGIPKANRPHSGLTEAQWAGPSTNSLLNNTRSCEATNETQVPMRPYPTTVKDWTTSKREPSR